MTVTTKPAPIVGVPPVEMVELSIPLTFKVYRGADGTIYPVASSNAEGGLVLATCNLASDMAAKAAIATALGLPGAYVSGNVGVYLTKAKVTPELRRLADARRAAMLADKAEGAPKAVAGVAFKIG